MPELIDELIIHNEKGEVIAIDDFKKNYIENNQLDNEKIYNFLYNKICSDDIDDIDPNLFNIDNNFNKFLEKIKSKTKKIEDNIEKEMRKINNLPEIEYTKQKGLISYNETKTMVGQLKEMVNLFRIQQIYALYYKFLFKEALVPTYFDLCDIPEEYLSQYKKINKLGFLTIDSQIGNCIEDKEYERSYISGVIFKKMGCKLASQLFKKGYNIILSEIHEENKLGNHLEYNLTYQKKNKEIKYFTNQPILHINNIYQIAQPNSPLFNDLMDKTFSIFICDTKYCNTGVLINDIVDILEEISPLKDSNWI